MNTSIRYKTVIATFIFCYLLILGKLFYWQIINYNRSNTKVGAQNLKTSTVKPKRGNIYDRNKNPLALSNTLYSISIYKPDLTIKNADLIAKLKITKNDITPENENRIQSFLENDNQKWLTCNFLLTSNQIKELADPGLSYSPVNLRYYPEADLGTLFLGKVSVANNEYTVVNGGLEQYYNRQLSGKSGFSWGAKDATGKTILSHSGWTVDPINGRNLYTSVNRELQKQVDEILKDGVKKYVADSGSITIMESETGKILSMSHVVATQSGTATPSAYQNPVISSLFEPGSIFKPLVVAMALDSKKINDNFICQNCQNARQIGQYSIGNWDNSYHPNSSLKDIIKNSDNVGMSYIIDELGLLGFLDYFGKLGLDKKTGIDLQGEVRPIIKKNWPEVDLATASFGQGFAITQIQMLSAFNSIANKGLLVTPQLVDYFEDDKKIVYPSKPKTKKVFEETAIDKVKQILKYSVENGVVAKFNTNNLDVCAKSGTSQIAINGKYSDSATIASYIGFSPCISPKFTMIVTINNPKSSPWGSSTAAPIWFEIANKLSTLL